MEVLMNENEENNEHRPEVHHFEIQIDHQRYTVELKHMTGLQLRHVPTPPIGPDRDLFEVVPGGSDRKIGDEEVVEIRNGLCFLAPPVAHHFEIQIDRQHYTVELRHMTGLQLRHVPTPPIGPERDLFEVVPGGSDRKISDEQVVEIRNGLRFFTAPSQINPGKGSSAREPRRVALQ
jgi:hypothetical protein